MKNKRMLVLLAGLVLAVGYVSGQDVIFKKDGTKLETKVIEIGPESVKYKKHSNLDGPDYVIRKSEILVIDYENGSHDSFADATKEEAQKTLRNARVEDYGKFMLNYNLINILVGRLAFGAEYLVGSGYLGIHPHAAFGLGQTLLFRELRYNFGLELRGYPMGQRRTSLFVGPGFEYGEVADAWGSWPGAPRTFDSGRAYYLMNGVLINFHKNFNVSFGLGLGYRTTTFGWSEPYGKVETNLILRF